MNALFDRFRAFLVKQSGICLEADRDYMVETRLAPVQRAFAALGAAELLQAAMSGTDPALTRAVVEAMLTGETFFFRDRQVFQTFREAILPEIMEARGDVRRLRIWCAACSTGQEPYSVAMILDEEARKLRGWQIEIVATDLSESALETAREGFYNQFEIQRGLPVTFLLRYFSRQRERWRIAEHLRSTIEFRRLNLITDPPPGVFDLIFCRNVLMYFAPHMKQEVLARLSAALGPDGRLLLGATENTSGLCAALEPDLRVPGVYRPHAAPRMARAARRASA